MCAECDHHDRHCEDCFEAKRYEGAGEEYKCPRCKEQIPDVEYPFHDGHVETQISMLDDVSYGPCF